MDNATVISAGIQVTGAIQGSGPLTIAGKVDGRVVLTGDVQVLDGAQVNASVEADRVAVNGMVRGNLKANEAVALQSNAKVEGEITCAKVEINPSAQLRGKLNMPVELPRGAAAGADKGRW